VVTVISANEDAGTSLVVGYSVYAGCVVALHEPGDPT
jgi:hypothetical protein